MIGNFSKCFMCGWIPTSPGSRHGLRPDQHGNKQIKWKKRSPKRRSLFFNAAYMQLASQLRLLTRLSFPSGNSPTLRVLRITQRMTWRTHVHVWWSWLTAAR
jgi:hypothetical protein